MSETTQTPVRTAAIEILVPGATANVRQGAALSKEEMSKLLCDCTGKICAKGKAVAKENGKVLSAKEVDKVVAKIVPSAPGPGEPPTEPFSVTELNGTDWKFVRVAGTDNEIPSAKGNNPCPGHPNILAVWLRYKNGTYSNATSKAFSGHCKGDSDCGVESAVV